MSNWPKQRLVTYRSWAFILIFIAAREIKLMLNHVSHCGVVLMPLWSCSASQTENYVFMRLPILKCIHRAREWIRDDHSGLLAIQKGTPSNLAFDINHKTPWISTFVPIHFSSPFFWWFNASQALIGNPQRQQVLAPPMTTLFQHILSRHWKYWIYSTITINHLGKPCSRLVSLYLLASHPSN